jgi:hypothetical protein
MATPKKATITARRLPKKFPVPVSVKATVK